jgi:hypothetical protein
MVGGLLNSNSILILAQIIAGVVHKVKYAAETGFTRIELDAESSHGHVRASMVRMIFVLFQTIFCFISRSQSSQMALKSSAANASRSRMLYSSYFDIFFYSHLYRTVASGTHIQSMESSSTPGSISA